MAAAQTRALRVAYRSLLPGGAISNPPPFCSPSNQAGAHFEKALTIARDRGEEDLVNDNKVNVGLAYGSLKFDEWMSQSIEASQVG